MEDKNKKKTLEEILEGIDDLKLYLPYTFDFAYLRSGKLEMIFNDYTNELVKYEGFEEEVRIPDGITAIGPAAFSHNVCLYSVDMPDSVEKIGDYAFYNCPRVTVHFGKNVKRIGKGAFISGNGDQYQMELPDSVEFIGKEAFIFLRFNKLPKNLKHIGAAAFVRGFWDSTGNDEAPWYAEIPDKVIEIGWGAFDGVEFAENCKGIWIPLSVQKIGKDAFRQTSALPSTPIHTLYYEGSEEQWKAIEIDNSNDWLKDFEIVFNCKRGAFDGEVEELEDKEVEGLEDEEVED